MATVRNFKVMPDIFKVDRNCTYVAIEGSKKICLG
jgi:hypothetical protein